MLERAVKRIEKKQARIEGAKSKEENPLWAIRERFAEDIAIKKREDRKK